MQKHLVVSTTDQKTGLVQLWAFFPNFQPFFYVDKVINRYADHAKLRDVQAAIAKLNDLNSSAIYAVPLSIVDPTAFTNTRLNYRGYTNDTAPLTIRKKALKEIKVTISRDNSLSFEHTSTYSDGNLTNCQKEELITRFFELVQVFNDPQTVATVQAIAKETILVTLKEDINKLRQQLNEVESFQG